MVTAVHTIAGLTEGSVLVQEDRIEVDRAHVVSLHRALLQAAGVWHKRIARVERTEDATPEQLQDWHHATMLAEHAEALTARLGEFGELD